MNRKISSQIATVAVEVIAITAARRTSQWRRVALKRAGNGAAGQEIARAKRQLLLDARSAYRSNDVRGFGVIHSEAPAATRKKRGPNE
jgi:hypothetical protein